MGMYLGGQRVLPIIDIASGLSEFDISGTLTVTLNMDGTKDWGDGTSDTSTTHTYASAGDYTITCDGSTMTTSSSSGLFGQNLSTPCSYVKEVRLGNNVTSIGTYAFQFCYSLVSITIPSSVTSIDSYVFTSCYSLTSIIIPEGVISIGSSVFRNCLSFTSISISSSVTSIGDRAFQDCPSLTNITIPEGVTSIGDYTFSGCVSILKYDFLAHSSIPTLSNTNAFTGINKICKIRVPASLESQWKATTNWSTYANYIEGV